MNCKQPKRDHSKRYPCLFCKALVLKLPDHLKKHLSSSDEGNKEVLHLIDLKKSLRAKNMKKKKADSTDSADKKKADSTDSTNSADKKRALLQQVKSLEKEKNDLLNSIRSRKLFIHNQNKFKKGKGTIPKSRGKADIPAKDFGACPNCLGMYRKAWLYKHTKICYSKASEQSGSKTKLRMPVVSSAKFMSASAPSAIKTEIFENEVVKKLRSRITGDDGKEIEDPVTKEVRNDKLIMTFGMDQIEVHAGFDQGASVRNKLRECGRLL